jgi:hypothetical protein
MVQPGKPVQLRTEKNLIFSPFLLDFVFLFLRISFCEWWWKALSFASLSFPAQKIRSFEDESLVRAELGALVRSPLSR